MKAVVFGDTKYREVSISNRRNESVLADILAGRGPEWTNLRDQDNGGLLMQKRKRTEDADHAAGVYGM